MGTIKYLLGKCLKIILWTIFLVITAFLVWCAGGVAYFI